MSLRTTAIVASCLAGVSAALAGGSATALETAVASAPAASGQTPAYDGVEETSLYIRSYDGTRLAVSIYRPTIGGQVEQQRLPVIVTQDRSSDPERFDPIRKYFVTRGYIVVSQDRRGTGASFGTQAGFVNDADRRDAKAVIDWLARQDFSTGKAGAMGCSNQGIWQYGVAALQPASLKAIAPACASPMFFDHAVTRNGVPIFPAKPAPYDGTCPEGTRGGAAPGLPPSPPKPVQSDSDGSLLTEALATRGCTAPMLGQYWLNMPRDGGNGFTGGHPGVDDTPMTRWRNIAASNIAILQLGGWYDAAVAGQIEAQRLFGGRVVMGPWFHGNHVPEGSAFPNAEFDLKALTLRWFDHFLKGADNGVNADGITYYTMNAPAGDEWRTVESWPVVASNSALFLADGALVSRRPQRGTPAEYAPRTVLWFDGKYTPLAHWWPGDMGAADAKSLVHTGAPLVEAVEMTGTPVAHLWISADKPDTNVFAVIEDVAPDGSAYYVTDGMARASWRRLRTPDWGQGDLRWLSGLEQDIAPLQPGVPAELTFDFFPISYVFRAGHRIRLSIATDVGNAYQAAPLAGNGATISIWRDAQHPSRLDLPLKRNGGRATD
ncbi:CocE/NonD family hydrolase [Sphingopyxis indica]|uniref:CocE/NonD family hydrolase n=1 Tax=Sphingopyxis indica TaxID=436663 RepID=UPI00293926CB|nr:CocE/NonD family hydrolase [Sphingopyxis indica]WOF42299.1 CocE/NonD family hydrolase [Sphingopyxis indica]